MESEYSRVHHLRYTSQFFADQLQCITLIIYPSLSVLNTIGEFLSQMYGMDSIIINQLMYGIRGVDGAFTSGYVKSMETQERWGWHKELLDAFENKSFMHVAETKLGTTG